MVIKASRSDLITLSFQLLWKPVVREAQTACFNLLYAKASYD